MTVREETKGYVLKRNEGRAIWFVGGLITWNALARDTGGQWAMAEQLGGRGFAAPIHVHEGDAEGFYVLEGQLTFVLDGERIPASAGSFVYVPPKVKHAFVVESPQARFLALVNPAMPFEAFVDELSVPAGSLTLPPPSPPDFERINAAAAKYGQQMFGPPPAPTE